MEELLMIEVKNIFQRREKYFLLTGFVLVMFGYLLMMMVFGNKESLKL